MTLRVLGSSSHGNCYILSDSKGNTLLLEAGIDPKKVRAETFGKGILPAACLVSHKHGDHAKYVCGIAKMGIPIYAHSSVCPDDFLGTFMRLDNTREFTVAGFKVRPMGVEHDAPCYAYYIEHPEGNIFFLTDTMYSHYRLPKRLSLALVECNYDDETLTRSIEEGITDPAMRPRLEHSHCELQTTLSLLRTAEHIGTTCLIHLSHDNANPGLMQRSAMAITGTPVHIATPGLEIQF